MPYTIQNLFVAIQRFSPANVREILNESPELINVCWDFTNKTPLTFILSENWRIRPDEAEEIVNILIENGADVNKGDAYGVRPLQFAIATASASFVKALVDAGVNQDFTIVDGGVEHTPLQYAHRIIDDNTNTDVIESLGQGVQHIPAE